jgi:hypothetical protein
MESVFRKDDGVSTRLSLDAPKQFIKHKTATSSPISRKEKEFKEGTNKGLQSIQSSL